MAIVVVGGGAIGLLVAGKLAQAGAVPGALLGRPSTVAALTAQPLTISDSGASDQIAGMQVFGAPEDLPVPFQQPDLAIVCVKGYDTPGVIKTLQILTPKQILTLQNGIGNEERLIAAFGAGQVLAGAITTSVDFRSASDILVTKEGGIGVAPCVPGGDTDFAVDALTQAGFLVERYRDYRALKWSKALLNMLGNASAAILDMPVPQIYADNRLADMEIRAVREALAVMRRIGIKPFNLPGYPAGTLAAAARFIPNFVLRPLLRRMVGGGRGGKDPSLLRDLRARRKRSEGEFLYGAIAAAAAEHGVPAPVNAALWRVLSAIVDGNLAWETYRGKPERLLAEI
ncbi:MAG: ketopantoate reductase family protein [Oscillochloris sp.]|nr:ketopantoate reductase family protein [Oscillochloris sp.]